MIIEQVNEGYDRVESSATYTLSANVEQLTLTGFNAINGTGNDQDNILIGNSAANSLSGGGGNDFLDGGAGGDVMAGGEYDDTFTVDNEDDVVIEFEDEGYDVVNSTVTHSLSSNQVEELNLQGLFEINGEGNELDNTINGNDVANTITGNEGDDTLYSGMKQAA